MPELNCSKKSMGVNNFAFWILLTRP